MLLLNSMEAENRKNQGPEQTGGFVVCLFFKFLPLLHVSVHWPRYCLSSYVDLHLLTHVSTLVPENIMDLCPYKTSK